MKCQKARNRGRNYHDVFKDRFSVSKIGLCIINKHNDVERIGIEEIASSTKRVELVDILGWSVVLEIGFDFCKDPLVLAIRVSLY